MVMCTVGGHVDLRCALELPRPYCCYFLVLQSRIGRHDASQFARKNEKRRARGAGKAQQNAVWCVLVKISVLHTLSLSRTSSLDSTLASGSTLDQ